MLSRQKAVSRLLPLIVAAAPLCAQGVTARLSGLVQNSTGAPLADAKVTIRNTETGLTRVVTTDASGRYLAVLLPVGPYSVTVTKAGYHTASNLKINLNLGDAAPMNVKLASETGSVVEVVADTAKVDAERASAAALISPEALTNLPVFNRGFTNLATLTPQAVVDSSRGNLAIAGQRGVNTSINIDGGDNNEPFFGGAVGAAEGKTPFTISIEAIREYQVVTDGASAEFGRMGGGYVNAVTKSGTNDLAGSLFYYSRPQSMVARQPNLNGVPDSNKVGDFKHQQFGFSVGGPIIKDKLFYFVAYDAQRLTSPVNMTWGGNSPVVLDPATYANDAVLVSKGGSYDSKADSDAVFLRFDYNPTPDHNIQFRLNHSKFNGDVGAGITAAYENLASDKITTDAYVLQWNWVMNSNWLNEFRVNYTTDDMPRVPYSTIPEVSITNVGYYGAYPFDRTYTTKRIQIQENISYATPRMQMKAGFDFNKVKVSEFFAGNWRGVYMFNTLSDFRNGLWSTYRQNFGLNGMSVQDAGQFDADYKQMALFIQTDWRISETFKLGIGIRWDKQANPSYPILDYSNVMASPMPLAQTIPSDDQFSPRLSFTWTPDFDHGKTVVRGSLGRYVSMTPSVFFYQVFAANGRRTGQVDFKAADAATFGIARGATWNAANPYWIHSFPTGSTLPKFNIWTFDPNFKNPYSDRANVGVERPFFGDLVLGFSYTYARTKQLERTEDMNVSAPSSTNAYGRLMYPARPNTTYGTMGYYKSDADSIYHAYTVSAKYNKPGSAFSGQIFYTYSLNKDTDSNERNYSGISIQDAGQLGKQWGYADTDRRNVVTGNVSFHERKWSGILASLAIRYQSGSPYTLLYSKDMNNDGNTSNDRFFSGGVDSGRNTLRTASQTSFDLGLRRDFDLVKTLKLTLSADIFNLFNHHDVYVQQYVLGSSTDAAPALGTRNQVMGSARQVQLGARLSF